MTNTIWIKFTVISASMICFSSMKTSCCNALLDLWAERRRFILISELELYRKMFGKIQGRYWNDTLGPLPLLSAGFNVSRSPFGIFDDSHQQSRWSGRGTLIFRHYAGRQIWSGCMSLHQAPRLSCLLGIHRDNLSP